MEAEKNVSQSNDTKMEKPNDSSDSKDIVSSLSYYVIAMNMAGYFVPSPKHNQRKCQKYVLMIYCISFLLVRWLFTGRIIFQVLRHDVELMELFKHILVVSVPWGITVMNTICLVTFRQFRAFFDLYASLIMEIKRDYGQTLKYIVIAFICLASISLCIN